jgi:hypothetical protein
MKSIPTQPDTAATRCHRPRPAPPVLNLLAACAAVTLAAVAIHVHDAGAITPQASPSVAAAAAEAPALWWTDLAQHPANRDQPLTANQTGVTAISPVEGHAGHGTVDRTGEPPAPWWAGRR